MSSLKNKNKKSSAGVYEFASHRSRQQEDGRDDGRSLDDIVVTLQREKSYVDKISEPGNEYIVETYIKVNNREWYLSSLVKHNGREIKNDEKLIREIRCRKPVPQADQTESRWLSFVKEAAKIHLEKYAEVKRRIEIIIDPHPVPKKKILFILILILVLAGIGYSGLLILQKFTDVKQPSTPMSPNNPVDVQKPPPQTPPDQPIKPLSPEQIEEMVLKILKNNNQSKSAIEKEMRK